MQNGYIRAYTKADDPEISQLKLRKMDAIEAEAVTGLPPIQSLFFAIKCSSEVHVIDYNGDIIGVFGVAPGVGGRGVPWLLATEALDKVQYRFARQSIDVIRYWLDTYPQLVNFVAKENAPSIKWLEWLGFTILEDIVVFNGVPFRQFYLNKE